MAADYTKLRHIFTIALPVFRIDLESTRHPMPGTCPESSYGRNSADNKMHPAVLLRLPPRLPTRVGAAGKSEAAGPKKGIMLHKNGIAARQIR